MTTDDAELIVETWRRIAGNETAGPQLTMSRQNLAALIEAHDHLIEVWKS